MKTLMIVVLALSILGCTTVEKPVVEEKPDPSVAKISKYKEFYPMPRWRQRIEDPDKPDDVLTDMVIQLSEVTLDKFLEKLIEAGDDKVKMMSAFEWAVKQFNEHNKQYSYIRKREQKELCYFFQTVADDNDLKSEDGDITAKWRKDW